MRLSGPADVSLTLRRRGDAGVEEAWERYAVPARWPTWSPQLRRVDYPHDRLRPHSRGTAHGPAGLRVAFRVDEVDEQARTWSWTVSLGPVRVRLDHGLEPEPGGGCRTWLRLAGPAAVVPAYAPAAWLALGRLVRR